MIVSTEFFEIGSNLKIGAAMEARNDLVFDALQENSQRLLTRIIGE